MDVFKILYTFFGGLGIFFFGMKLMSDSLQQAAGDVITKVINSLTKNRIMAVTVGMLVTMIVQSSSVTTVMVVGFVNAGLMNLTQAIGIIFGANIGTTITGWIISINISSYSLLLVGVGIFPIIFSKSQKLQNIGKVVFGIGLIFLGLQFMSDAFKPLRDNQEFLKLLSTYVSDNYSGYFVSILLGCLLTMIIQSSSAMLGITIALASVGVISFHTAAALVLGENIGTTITAILASVGTGTNAKRAARAHAFFNLMGVAWIFPLTPYYFNFVDWAVPGDVSFVNAEGNYPYIAAHIAAVHTFFNIANTLLFIPFLNLLARFVVRITPDKSGEKEINKLIMVGDPSTILPAAAISQAHQELVKMDNLICRMYKVTKDHFMGETSDSKLLAKISNYEVITDNIQKEITIFLIKVMVRPLTSEQSRQAQALIKIADEFESIADYLDRISRYRARFEDHPPIGISREEYISYMEEVWNFYNLCVLGGLEPEHHDLNHIRKRSEELRIISDSMRDKHLDRVAHGDYDALSSLTFSDMVVALRKIRAHALNVAEAGNNYY